MGKIKYCEGHTYKKYEENEINETKRLYDEGRKIVYKNKIKKRGRRYKSQKMK